MICVHGLTRNGRDFDCLAHALEGDGRQVFCPDIVGRGKSDWLANAVDYNYAQYLTDILLHGLHSDVLSTPIAEEMTQRGPCAQLVEFPKIGHAPALMEPTQIATIAEFLRP